MWHEVVVDAEGQPGAKAIRDASWIETQAVSNQDLVQALRQDLDDGEGEAIALAVETDSPLLIMDEQHGRARADHFEIPCIGGFRRSHSPTTRDGISHRLSRVVVMTEEHDRVVLTESLPEQDLQAGDVGTVVHVYGDGSAFEIEFFHLDGRTVTVETVSASTVRPVASTDVTHARTRK
ncbi:MAG: DUF4926 domain-containing protein [Salinibacter sp.]